MTQENDLIFREEQKFGLWLRLVLFSSVPVKCGQKGEAFMGRRSAFTIVELLVVVAIVALLTSIIKRHELYSVNVLFLDWSVSSRTIKQLWKLKWHREWPGDSDLPVWPDWMAEVPEPD